MVCPSQQSLLIPFQQPNVSQVHLLPFKPMLIFLAIKTEEKDCFKDGFLKALIQLTSASNNLPPRARGISLLSITSSLEQKVPMTRAYTLLPLTAPLLLTNPGRRRRKGWREKSRAHRLQSPTFVRSVVRLQGMMAKMRRTSTVEFAVRLVHFNLFLQEQQTSILLQHDEHQLAKPPSREHQLIRLSFLHSWRLLSTQGPPPKSQRRELHNRPQQTCPRQL